MYDLIMRAIEMNKDLVIRKYKRSGWGNWKPVSAEVALHKITIFVDNGLDEDDYDYRVDCPYEVALAEDVIC